MSMALRDIIPLMELIKEMRERKFDIVNTQPYVYVCKVLRIILVHLNLPEFYDSVHAPTPSISMCAITIFVSMSGAMLGFTGTRHVFTGSQK